MAAPAGAPQVTAAAAASPPSGDVLDQLAKLGELKAAGVLTEAEFQAQKTRILNSWPPGRNCPGCGSELGPGQLSLRRHKYILYMASPATCVTERPYPGTRSK